MGRPGGPARHRPHCGPAAGAVAGGTRPQRRPRLQQAKPHRPLGSAIALFNDYYPLLKLGRLDEAVAVLRDCLSAFRNANDALGIAKTLSALANAESDRGNDEVAIQLERDALRYHYLTNNVSGIAISYHDYGNDCHRLRQATLALASHLAAALISLLANSSLVNTAIRSAATDLQEFGATAVPPVTVEQLCSQLDGIPGTDLPGLIASLCPDPGDAWLRLRLLVYQAQTRAAAPARRGAGTKRREALAPRPESPGIAKAGTCAGRVRIVLDL